MSNTVITKLNERYEQLNAETRATAEKMSSALRGAAKRVEQSSTELFESLVKSGEKRQKELAKTAKTASKKAAQKVSTLDELRGKLAEALGLPTQSDVEALNKKLNTLTRKVNKLAKEAS
ncbi:poly(hydroxyalkanoate) granule-associated protein [Alcanivorax sediminis]|uniref:Poly(Hydroxyalkanoate) granule-associated protein n=1 Tax=Alcanivorax sediminis TaxID=2663008 RepID=A0A6N7LWV3_9GAMM|nr:poly(hydroxyalkanoate) granule-associated protein [Alcanivorax sediminis]MQX53866.1 poly(hydroxyalkanoate) granule-associated protein [Alcanivorax sediminis]